MSNKSLITLGWREIASLPDLGIASIKMKIDTGAKTSALHAIDISVFQKNQQEYVRFKTQPLLKENTLVNCEALLVDQRQVRNSGGQNEKRYVIQTKLVIANKTWPIEMTLSNRSNMRFKMLLGRRAMVGNVLVDPSKSYLCR